MTPRALFALSAVLALAGCNRTGTGTPAPTWQLAWSDEFDGPQGQLPSAANWRFDVGGGGWGNNQLEHNTDRAENASLDGNGHLVITARRESYQGNQYTSARITTEGKQQFRYGKIEARLRLPSGQGLWPAFWMLGGNFRTAGWPNSGEIDVMEFRGQQPSTVIGSLHGPGYSGGSAISRQRTLEGTRLDQTFHVYTVEWSVDGINWLIDGQRYHSVARTGVPGAWVFDHPFFIILNVAVGGNFVGAPNASTTFPQTMLVDWVRVYEQAD